MSQAAGERLLNPELLSRLADMRLIARVVVEGFLLGLHRSPYRGFSVEFSQYRPYMPGDEIRNIDWKVFGRTDRLFIKEFEEETNLFGHVLLDASRSMRVGGEGLSKFDYGRYLAAALAYLLARQQDAVGMVAFDKEVVEYLPARCGQGHLESILISLEKLQVREVTDLGPPLHQVAEQIRKRGLVLLISDLQPREGEDWEEQREELEQALAHFRFNGHELLVFHVLDHDELEFTFDRGMRFVDPETGTELVTAPERIREGYLEQMSNFLREMEEICARYDVDYVRLDTAQPLDYALSAYLATRQRMI
jgi:uncharacterized protein (DUF58 family)